MSRSFLVAIIIPDTNTSINAALYILFFHLLFFLPAYQLFLVFYLTALVASLIIVRTLFNLHCFTNSPCCRSILELCHSRKLDYHNYATKKVFSKFFRTLAYFLSSQILVYLILHPETYGAYAYTKKS